jgi:methionyl-tRNA formyltransferase
MRIVIITQDDPFYLAENIEYLVNNLSSSHHVVACILFKASPFGKRMKFLEKALRSIRVFGIPFVFYYGVILVKNRILRKKNIARVLKKNRIPKIALGKSINHEESIGIIKQYNPDLLISIAGNQIFKKDLIELAPKGCLNVHTALLPKYRGLMPSFWVLRHNEKETGVSVFFVDEGIDSGPIVVQKRIAIENKTQQELIRETKRLGMDAILEAIQKIENGDYRLIPNNDHEKTYFSFPQKEDVKAFRKIGKKFF